MLPCVGEWAIGYVGVGWPVLRHLYLASVATRYTLAAGLTVSEYSAKASNGT